MEKCRNEKRIGESEKILKWFTENYIESPYQCAFLLREAEKKYLFTREQFYTGCFELRKMRVEKAGLKTHLELLGVMSNVGIHSNVAGIKLREAILQSSLFPELILKY